MMMAPEHKHGLQTSHQVHVCLRDCSLSPTNFRFVQQTYQEAKGPEVSNHILRIALHILKIEDVDHCLRSEKQKVNDLTNKACIQ